MELSSSDDRTGAEESRRLVLEALAWATDHPYDVLRFALESKDDNEFAVKVSEASGVELVHAASVCAMQLRRFTAVERTRIEQAFADVRAEGPADRRCEVSIPQYRSGNRNASAVATARTAAATRNAMR